MAKTTAVTLAKHPQGEPKTDDFAVVEVDAPEVAPADGVLVKVDLFPPRVFSLRYS